MNHFDEAWLRAHMSKMQSTSVSAGPIQFTLAQPYKLLNVLLRMHWAARGQYAAKLSREAAALTSRRLGQAPLERAAVFIERHSIQEPDVDGVAGGAKPVIDMLLVRSKRHPHGLGFIVDDSPEHMTLEVRHVKAATRKAQCTAVRIEALA